jgi:hypothetical protein
VWENDDNLAAPIVMAQAFNSDGTEATAPFIVPSYANKTSYTPDVAMAYDGTFIVTWRGPDVDFNTGIQVRMYNADGTPKADQFRANILADASYNTPSIAMRSDKTFIVVWSQYDSADMNPEGWLIRGQRFSAAGSKVGNAFLISPKTGADTYGAFHKINPDIDIADNGNFVVVWDDYRDTLTYSYMPYGKRFNSSGTALGSEFRISTTDNTMQEHVHPRVSVAANGLFVATWHTYIGTGTYAYDVYARRYNASGTAQGNDWRVNDHTANYQWYPDVACDRDGNFTIVYESWNQPDDPITVDYGVIAKQYAADGTARSGYIINNPSLEHRGIGDQTNVTVTRKCATGMWSAAWDGLQGIAPDGGVSGIWHSQIVGSPIPAIAWSFSAPLSGTYSAGTIIPITWTAYGIQSGYTVCLCYSTNASPSGGTKHWISVGEIAATNGTTTWSWNSTGAVAGTYYIGGYIWNGSSPTYAWGSSTFIIT